LLLLIRAHPHRSPLPEAPRPSRKVRDYTAELLTAALFLSGWCVLRLLVPRDTSHFADAVIALSGLLLGVGTAAECLRSLRAARLRLRAERIRARAAKREARAARRRSRARRHG